MVRTSRCGRDNPGSTPGVVIWVDFILGHDGLAPLFAASNTTHDHPKEIADERERERERKNEREREGKSERRTQLEDTVHLAQVLQQNAVQ